MVITTALVMIGMAVVAVLALGWDVVTLPVRW
jgi:hypothetical protein